MLLPAVHTVPYKIGTALLREFVGKVKSSKEADSALLFICGTGIKR